MKTTVDNPFLPPAGGLFPVSKAEWRKELMHRRTALSAEYRAAGSRAITNRLLQAHPLAGVLEQAARVFVYVSYRDEVDTHPLIHSLLAARKTVCVPKIISKTIMYACRLTAWADCQTDRMGILTPASGSEDHGLFDVALTPGLGFTESGTRIGYGAGFYDRWFAAQHALPDAGPLADGLPRRPLKIALAFDCQMVSTLPTSDRDIPVDFIATESRLITVSKK